MTTLKEILASDVVNVEDIINYYESLKEDNPDKAFIKDKILDYIKEGGCDIFWYPDRLITDYYMSTYAQDLAEDVIGQEICYTRWPYNCIDWDRVIQEFESDCNSIDIIYDEEIYSFYYR